MPRSLLAAPLLALLACSGGQQDDVLHDDLDTGELEEIPSCEAQLAKVTPSHGALNVPLDAVITAEFTRTVVDGQWELNVLGVEGELELATNGRSATFTPSAPLEQGGTYEIIARACAEEVQTTFLTIGPPVEASDILGRTYVIDFEEVEWVRPAIAGVLRGELELEYLLVHIAAVHEEDDTLDVVGAVGDKQGEGAVQAACYPPLDYGNADFSNNPTFTGGPEDFHFTMQGDAMVMEDLVTVATFNADGSLLLDVNLKGFIDTRPLDPYAMAEFGMDVCETAALFGDECEPCRDGVVKCLDGWVIADVAPWVPGVEVDLAYDPAFDHTCP